MMEEKTSPYGFEQTVSTIVGNAKSHGWVTPKVYDFQKTLVKHELADPGRIKVIKLCHPETAARMLNNDQHKFVSTMMPCSISVYEKADGTTYVSSMNLRLMSRLMGGEVGQIMREVEQVNAQMLAFLQQP
jgi:uncharacterized protein (DUF302 family)